MLEFLKTKYAITQKNANLFKMQIPSEELCSTIHFIKTNSNFITLSQISCCDWIEESIFALNYIVTNDARNINLMVEVAIQRESPSLPSMLFYFAQAEIMERDLHEMYGIDFVGNKTLFDFALEGWEDIPPLRREFDTLKYVQEHYEFRGGRDDNKDVKEEVKRRKEEAKKQKEEALNGL